MNWQLAVERTVVGMGYELVDCARSAGGLLSVYIDRVPQQVYSTGPGEFITVDDCERVTRQLQHVLEVENCDYQRLEVSSPGLDRPLRREADYARFAGLEIELTLKRPFQGRKKFRGVLQPPVPGGEGAPPSHELVFLEGTQDQVLGFALDEVRDARLVPVVDFKKGRKRAAPAGQAAGATGEVDESGGHEQ